MRSGKGFFIDNNARFLNSNSTSHANGHRNDDGTNLAIGSDHSRDPTVWRQALDPSLLIEILGFFDASLAHQNTCGTGTAHGFKKVRNSLEYFFHSIQLRFFMTCRARSIWVRSTTSAQSTKNFHTWFKIDTMASIVCIDTYVRCNIIITKYNGFYW